MCVESLRAVPYKCVSLREIGIAPCRSVSLYRFVSVRIASYHNEFLVSTYMHGDVYEYINIYTYINEYIYIYI